MTIFRFFGIATFLVAGFLGVTEWFSGGRALLILTPQVSGAVVPAIMSDLAADEVGVNVHLDYTDTIYGMHYDDIVKPRLIESGIRHIRDNGGGGIPSTALRAKWKDLRTNNGITLLYQGYHGADDLAVIRDLNATINVVDGIEPPNERDIHDTGWQTNQRNYIKDMYPRVKADAITRNIPYLGASFAHTSNSPGIFQSTFTDAANYMDVGNSHDYPAGLYPEGPGGGGWGITDVRALDLNRYGSAKPVWATEVGYRKFPDDPGHRAVSERAAAKYFPREFLWHLTHNSPRVYIYQLVDNGQSDELGIINHDGSVRQQFTAIKNYINLFKDPGAPFTTSGLDYTLSGDTANVQQLLLQKRNGVFYLVLWQAVSSSNGPADIEPARKAVTVHFNSRVTAVHTYEPSFNANVIQTVTNDAGITTMDVQIPDYLLVLEINGTGAPIGTGTTATTGTGTTGTTGGTGTGGTVTGGVGSAASIGFEPCHERFDNNTITPAKYGAAYNVFSGAKELLLNLSCDGPGSDVSFSINTPDTSTPKYVYKNGYRWNGGSWVPFTFEGIPVPGSGGNWLRMGATTTIRNADLRPSPAYTFFAAYTCTFANSSWNCGCRDTFCTVHFWQLQATQNPNGGFFFSTGGGTPGGGTVGGTTGGGTSGPEPACTGSNCYPWPPEETPGCVDIIPTSPRAPITVNNATELSQALLGANAGDLILVGDNTYLGNFSINRTGTKSQPIVIRALNRLSPVFMGEFTVGGTCVILEGMKFQGGTGINVTGTHDRVSRNLFINTTDRNAINISRTCEYCRIDRNEIGNYSTQGIGFDTNTTDGARNTLVDRNYVHDRQAGPGGNLEECIQVGQTYSNSAQGMLAVIELNLVTNNLFTDDCISIKSSRNIIRGNTVKNVKGGIVLRNGSNNIVISNFIRQSTGAIVGQGANQRVIGNNFEGDRMEVLARDPGDTVSQTPEQSINWLMAGNRGTIIIGKGDGGGPVVKDGRIEAHVGAVNYIPGHYTNVQEFPTTAETWIPAVELNVSQVGPNSI